MLIVHEIVPIWRTVMGTENPGRNLSFEGLKTKQRGIREGFPENLGLRVHRAISWVHRAEQAADDHDAAFIFFWIAFNAAYAEEQRDPEVGHERSVFAEYFEKAIELDGNQEIYDLIWSKYSDSIRLLLDNKYVFNPFWKHHNGAPGYDGWEDGFARSRRRIQHALRQKETRIILCTLFDRLYVLRNQLIHGGATWNSSVNRSQVQDGARILASLVPLFIDLMMDNPEFAWGDPYYPVVE